MDTLITTILAGIGAGALDALLALGIVLIYRTTGVLNFSQAGIGALATFVIYSVSQGHPLALALAAGMLAGAAAGMAVYEIVRGIGGGHVALSTAVATIAVAVLIQQIVRIGWGSNPAAAFPTPFGFDSFAFGSITLSHLSAAAILVAIVLALGIGVLLRWTRPGRMLRALADSPEAASLCGGDPHVLTASVWALAGALAAVAGFFAAQIVFFPSFLDTYFVASLIAAVLGGLRSLSGAFLGAVILEITRNLLSVYAPSTAPYESAILVAGLVAVLAFAPRHWLTAAGRRTV